MDFNIFRIICSLLYGNNGELLRIIFILWYILLIYINFICSNDKGLFDNDIDAIFL